MLETELNDTQSKSGDQGSSAPAVPVTGSAAAEPPDRSAPADGPPAAKAPRARRTRTTRAKATPATEADAPAAAPPETAPPAGAAVPAAGAAPDEASAPPAKRTRATRTSRAKKAAAADEAAAPGEPAGGSAAAPAKSRATRATRAKASAATEADAPAATPPAAESRAARAAGPPAEPAESRATRAAGPPAEPAQAASRPSRATRIAGPPGEVAVVEVAAPADSGAPRATRAAGPPAEPATPAEPTKAKSRSRRSRAAAPPAEAAVVEAAVVEVSVPADSGASRATRAAGPPAEPVARATRVAGPPAEPAARAARAAGPPAEPAAPATRASGPPARPGAIPGTEAPVGEPGTVPGTAAPIAGFSAPEPVVPVAQPAFQAPRLIFQPPEVTAAPAADGEPGRGDEPARGEPGRGNEAPRSSEAGRGTRSGRQADQAKSAATAPADEPDHGPADEEAAAEAAAEESAGRRRRRGGRGRSKGRAADGDDSAQEQDDAAATTDAVGAGDAADADDDGDGGDADDSADGPGRRRRRRRRRGSGADSDQPGPDDPPETVVHVREPRAAAPRTKATRDEVQGLKGSTRLEAKKQRRREGRDSGRRRPPVITESEFLARREAVDRSMVVRQRGDRTQIAVLEDGVLVEHYVDKSSHQSFVGNVYLGKVQNVLPSMEAAFVDIGKGRNAVLYAGEVNFDASGLEGQTRRIESALKSGQSVLVQATKDPVGHKGARLTSQISLPGRYLVYVPGASMTGISRKLPDTERTRLKQILKKVMPEGAGVIVRTAAEGATDEELSQDVARLTAQWESIERKAKSASPPELLYSEPDLTVRVVRDIFNEDFTSLVVEGEDGWDTVDEYVNYVAPHLADRLSRWQQDQDVFARYRIDEQLAKALERKVWLPSGGSLVIDRTEAMTVVDVNTGKFTGQGGNLEETVTRNNLEAAEEIVRQLRLRDIGGIIVIDFIDMVLESNRDLVLRRLLECLARDRTKHQVAEVTSLGLVQMTRKRVGSGLLEAFSVPCECCNGRGVIVSLEPTELTPPGHHRHSDQRGGADAEADKGQGGAAEDKPSGSRRRRRKSAPAASGPDTAATVAAVAVIAAASGHADGPNGSSAEAPAGEQPGSGHPASPSNGDSGSTPAKPPARATRAAGPPAEPAADPASV